MMRRPRPGGARHPPPLAPTVSNFKPRAQWSNSGSSIFLYVNLPGFYKDQIEIKKDERTRIIQIQGERPLSSQTKARFQEAYRVPDTCDMTKLKTSFSHGLLTFEFSAVVAGEKQEKAVQDQGKIAQKPNQEVSKRPGPNGSSLGQKKPLLEEKQAAPMANREEPKTYKSVVEGKRAAPTSSQQKLEPKMGEASPSLVGKGRAKEEKAVERKEAAQMGQHKIVEKLKEEEARSSPTIGSPLKPTVRGKEEKVIERKKGADINQNKTAQKEKEVSRTSIIGGSLEHKVHAKAEQVVGESEMSQKVKEEGKSGLGQKKEVKYTEPAVRDDEARRPMKGIAATKPKTKERVESIARDVNGNMTSNQDEKMVREGEIQERVEQKMVEESGLIKETEDVKDNARVAKPKRVNFENTMKEGASRGGEDREKMVDKSSESEIGPLLDQGQKKTEMDPPAVEEEQESHKKSDLSLVNVGVAVLVIMGFGAYIFLPLLK